MFLCSYHLLGHYYYYLKPHISVLFFNVKSINFNTQTGLLASSGWRRLSSPFKKLLRLMRNLE